MVDPSSGIAAILQRFLTTAPERLTALSEIVGGLADAPDQAERVKRIGRDLHTLKGEARLLGLDELVAITHKAEDMLHSRHRAGRLDEEAQQLLYEVVDTLFACVQAHTEKRAQPTDLIDSLIPRLEGATVDEVCRGSGGQAADVAREDQPTVAQSNAGSGASPSAVAGTEEHPSGTVMPAPSGEEVRTIQIRVAAIDKMTDLVSALSAGILRNQQLTRGLAALSEQLRLLGISDGAWVATGRQGEGGRVDTLHELQGRLLSLLRDFRDNGFMLGQSSVELSEEVRGSRLRPLRTAFMQYPSFVRRAAREQGKKILLEMRGSEVALDQKVIDEISEPCLHLLRNSVTHGIETPAERRAAHKPEEGLIAIQAKQDGELVRIEFGDDGRGIDVDRVRRRALALRLISEENVSLLSDADAIKLAFSPGLSTATETTELAGRGVGLDVVKSVLDRMAGSVAVESTPGRGTRFILQVPVSLSLMRVLLVTACDQTFAVPNASVVEVRWLPVSEIRTVEGREVITFRDRLLPLLRLRDILGMRGIKDIFVNKLGLLVLRSQDELAGFIVDSFLGEREIVTQPFSAFLGRPRMSSGVTLTESGEVILLLHPPDLIRAVREPTARAAGVAATSEAGAMAHRILYVEDSFVTREYAAAVLRSRGYAVVEAGDGLEALDRLKEQKFDLILTDLQMPRLDGFKLTAAIRKDPRTKNTPVVVLSTLDSQEAKRMALAAGADTYLIKSQFSADLLLDTIKQMLG